jgi:hypothetical protein
MKGAIRLTHGLFNVRLQGLALGELALHVGGQPYPTQGPAAGKDGLGVEL